MRRLGVLLPYAENDAEAKSHLSALTQETQTAGVVQDRNIRIDIRYAANCALAPSALSGSEATVYLPLEIDIGECLPLASRRSFPQRPRAAGKRAWRALIHLARAFSSAASAYSSVSPRAQRRRSESATKRSTTSAVALMFSCTLRPVRR